VKITFSDLRNISDSLEKKDDRFLLNYLNSFEGDNVYEKFKNILICWESDISYTLDMSSSEKSTKLQLQFIIDAIPDEIGGYFQVSEGNFLAHMKIPDKFTRDEDIVPIYELIESLEISGVNIKPKDLENGREVVDNLPANIYNKLFKAILNNRDNLVSFGGESFNFSVNFLTNDPYMFLRGLFTPYGKDYFRDIIYHLSNKIDSHILMDSTIHDVEYYVEKLQEERKSDEPPTLG